MDYFYAFLILVAFLLGMFVESKRDPISVSNNTSVPSPRVVVNIPSDYKALEPLMVDGKPAVVGPRALLFYSVYTKAIEGFTIDGTYSLGTDEEVEAYNSAAQAVEKVYGETFDA